MTRQTKEKKDLETTKTKTLPLKFLACIEFNDLKFCISTQYSGKYMPITLRILTVSHLPDTLLFSYPAHCEHMLNFNVYVAPMKSQ